MAKDVTIRFRATASFKKRLDDYVAEQKRNDGPDNSLTRLIENATRHYFGAISGQPASVIQPPGQAAAQFSGGLERLQKAADGAETTRAPRKRHPTPR